MKGLHLPLVLLASLFGALFVSSCPTLTGSDHEALILSLRERILEDPEIARAEGKRLIKMREDQPAFWMTMEEVESLLVQKHLNFIDITDYDDFPVSKPLQDAHIQSIPETIRYESVVNSILPRLNNSRMEQFVIEFSSFHNRYYTAVTGQQSEQWLLALAQEAIRGYVGTARAEIFFHAWLQKSIIVRIEGSDPVLREERVIIGAHQDSINRFGGALLAPGADDNGSGSVVVLEALRVLVESGYIPKRTIEFHWYAAEEVGLRGSGDIARTYRNTGVNVVSMLNFDVTGYHTPGVTDVGIFTDFTNPQLTQLLRIVVDAYLDYGRRNSQCGYACSDHASWTSNGFPSAMPSEVNLTPMIHTVDDVYQTVEIPQVREFAKMAVGYLVEMSEPAN